MEWQEQKSSFPPMWDAQEHEEITGEIVKIFNGQFGSQYSVKLDTNNTITVQQPKENGAKVPSKIETLEIGTVVQTPSHRVLQGKMEKSKIGMLVKIVCEGEDNKNKKSGKSPAMLYRVYLADPTKIDYVNGVKQ